MIHPSAYARFALTCPPSSESRLGLIAPNKPNLPPPTGKGADGQGCKCCRRWGRARKTKPIPSERHEWQVLCRKRVMRNWTRHRPLQNKANLHRSVKFEVSSVKVENPASSPSSLPTSNFTLQTSDGPLAGPVVQTNPICRHGQGWTRAGEVARGAVAWARCAKQTQFVPHRVEMDLQSAPHAGHTPLALIRDCLLPGGFGTIWPQVPHRTRCARLSGKPAS
jgi:hypothetical protein